MDTYQLKKWMTRKRIIICFFVIVLISLLYLYPKKEKKLPQVVVTVAPVKVQDVVVETSMIGNIIPYKTVNVKSLIDGQILKVSINNGEMVKTNQLLFSIDPRPLQVQLTQAQANLIRDQASFDTAKDILQRSSPLTKKGYVTKQAYDQLKNNLAVATAVIKADEAAIQGIELQLSYCSIYSPIDGKAGVILIQQGNLVKANDSNPLVVINQISPIFASFNVPEKYLYHIRKNMEKNPIEVKAFINGKENALTGTLSFIDNSVDITTGTIQMRAIFPNTQQELWPGQYVQVKIPIMNLSKANLISSIALQAGPNGNYVFIVDAENKIKLQPVETGPTINDYTVIKSGVSPGQLVVTSGQLNLTEGTQVTFAKPEVTK